MESCASSTTTDGVRDRVIAPNVVSLSGSPPTSNTTSADCSAGATAVAYGECGRAVTLRPDTWRPRGPERLRLRRNDSDLDDARDDEREPLPPAGHENRSWESDGSRRMFRASVKASGVAC